MRRRQRALFDLPQKLRDTSSKRRPQQHPYTDLCVRRLSAVFSLFRPSPSHTGARLRLEPRLVSAARTRPRAASNRARTPHDTRAESPPGTLIVREPSSDSRRWPRDRRRRMPPRTAKSPRYAFGHSRDVCCAHLRVELPASPAPIFGSPPLPHVLVSPPRI